MQTNIERNFEMKGREMRQKEITDAYHTAQDMLTKFNSYMDENDKKMWFKILNSKALIIAGQQNESNSTCNTPAPYIREDKSVSRSRSSSITSTSSTSTSRNSSASLISRTGTSTHPINPSASRASRIATSTQSTIPSKSRTSHDDTFWPNALHFS